MDYDPIVVSQLIREIELLLQHPDLDPSNLNPNRQPPTINQTLNELMILITLYDRLLSEPNQRQSLNLDPN